MIFHVISVGQFGEEMHGSTGRQKAGRVFVEHKEAILFLLQQKIHIATRFPFMAVPVMIFDVTFPRHGEMVLAIYVVYALSTALWIFQMES